MCAVARVRWCSHNRKPMAFSRAWPDFTRGVMPTPIFVYANPAFCALTQYELVRNTCNAVVPYHVPGSAAL
jgi:hypothetical protein